MIPDKTFIFKRYGVPRNFDDHQVRLRYLLQQDAMPTLESGRHVLTVCQVCKRPWYKAGRQEYPRLTPEQLVFLGAVLHVDTSVLSLLPRALCPICSTVYLGGIFSVEEYRQHRGYRFLWESALLPRSRLMAMIFRRKGLTLDALVPLSREPHMESSREMRSVLTWLEMSPFTETIRAYPDEHCQHLAWRYPLGNLVDEKGHQWKGYAWDAPCPPLGGNALVTLAVADDSPALAPLTILLLSWSILARAMRLVL
jgi:hypothetical protein